MKFSTQPYWRYALIASTSSGLAYLIATQIPHVSPIVASITALIAVRPTFHASAREGVSQILAIFLGALVAFLLNLTIGYTSIVVFLAIFASFVLAKLLKMENAGIGIAISVLIVFGPHLDSSALKSRFFGVALGALIALIGSFWTRPGKPHERALDAILSQEMRLPHSLALIGNTLAKRQGDLSEGETTVWLDKAKKIDRMVVEIRNEAEDALKGRRWSPLINEEDAMAVIQQVRIVQALVHTVQNIIRDLRVASRQEEAISPELAIHLSEVILATSEVISEQSEVAADNPAGHVEESPEELEGREEIQRTALEHIRELDDSTLLIGGSIIQDTNKINNILTGN